MESQSRGRRPITIVPTHRPPAVHRGTRPERPRPRRPGPRAPTGRDRRTGLSLMRHAGPVAPAEATPPSAPTTDAVAGQASQTAPSASPKKGGLGRLFRNLVLGVLATRVLGVAASRLPLVRGQHHLRQHRQRPDRRPDDPGGRARSRPGLASVRYDVGDRVNQGDVMAS